MVRVELVKVFLVAAVLVPERSCVVLIEAHMFRLGWSVPLFLVWFQLPFFVASVLMARQNCDCITMNTVSRFIDVISGVTLEFSCQAAAKRAHQVMRQDVAPLFRRMRWRQGCRHHQNGSCFFSASAKGGCCCPQRRRRKFSLCNIDSTFVRGEPLCLLLVLLLRSAWRRIVVIFCQFIMFWRQILLPGCVLRSH